MPQCPHLLLTVLLRQITSPISSVPNVAVQLEYLVVCMVDRHCKQHYGNDRWYHVICNTCILHFLVLLDGKKSHAEILFHYHIAPNSRG